MKRTIATMMSAAFLFAATGGVSLFADEHDGRIQQRKENQQGRIAQGVNNGSLTAGETSRLEHREANLNREVRADRRANGGNLTNREKAQINRQQNHLSNSIYRDKHNAAHQSQ